MIISLMKNCMLFTRLAQLTRLTHLQVSAIRLKSNQDFESSEIQVTLIDDGQTIICLHQESLFPYEHSKPLPATENNLAESNSVIKNDLLKETHNILFAKDYSEEDLIRLTHTSRSTWQGRKFYNRKAKTNPPKNRDGI